MKRLLVLHIVCYFALCAYGVQTGCISDQNSAMKVRRSIENIPAGGYLNFTFKSKIDSSAQPFLMKLPTGYTKSKQWPLLVVLHGLGDGPIAVSQIDSMVQVGPFGRGNSWYRDAGEKDVFECIEIVRQICNIDPNRIYLCGFSMGAAGTFELGLKYPDMWAACVPVCGRLGDQRLINNGGNLSFWINAGSEDGIVPARLSEDVYNKAMKLGYSQWKYTEHNGMGHSFDINWGDVEKWLLAQKRVEYPKNITFSCDRPAKAYWAEILAKETSAKYASISVKSIDQTITVETKNVSSYRLYLDCAPIKKFEPVVINENGKNVFSGKVPKDGIFSQSRKSINDKN